MNERNGWYEKLPEDGTRIALIHEEVSELLTANRKGKVVDPGIRIKELLEINDDESFKKAYETVIKGNEEEEVADIIIRALDWGYNKGVDMDTHVALKLRYNSLRGYKHGGKKY